MFTAQTILVPVDFSNTASAAISVALQMADRSGGRVIFFHVDDTVRHDLDAALSDANTQAAQVTAQIQKHEKAIVDAVRLEVDRAAQVGEPLQATPHEIRISGGNWVEVALQLIEEEEVDLVVAATHGGERGGLRGLLLRPDAERLVSKAPCSVFVVRPAGFPYLTD